MSLTTKTLATAAVLLAGSLGLASGAAASDATVKAAFEVHDAQFHTLAGQQAKAFGTWVKAHHSKKTSKPVLRSLQAADRLTGLVTKAVEAQPSSTPTGEQAKQQALASNTSYSHYLTSLERAVRLATNGKTRSANRQLTLAGGYAKQSAQQSQAAKRLFTQAP